MRQNHEKKLTVSLIIWPVDSRSLFGAPTPAHTWIGFVPTGIQRDLANHWSLTREPQIIIFNINDFGSFALGDEMARTRVTSFQQMLTERPATFNDEIPVLPLINAAQMIRSQVRRLDFGSGMGVRFVTEYSQDNLPLINDRLMYVFYGMTSVVAGEPQHGQILAGSDIFEAPVGGETIGTLATGEAVVVNGLSSDGRRSRILCLDGTTGNCWVDTDVVQINDLAEAPVLHSGGMPEVGQVVQITAVSDNSIYAEPSDKATRIGSLLAGEVVEIFGPDETEAWLSIACPRGIGAVCWVVSDTAVNEPTGFFAGDGWQDIAGEYVSFRVPDTWQPTIYRLKPSR